MSVSQTLTTADQLAALPDDGKRYELVLGELRVMSPAGGNHGRIALRIARLLANYVEQHGMGETFAAETGFLLSTNPDTVRAPDAAFVNASAFEQLKDIRGYLPVAPDLVVEVVSPSDSFTAVEEKSRFWIDHGVRLVIVVDADNQTIRTYRDQNTISVHQSGDTVDASDVVTGWTFKVDDVW